MEEGWLEGAEGFCAYRTALDVAQNGKAELPVFPKVLRSVYT